MYTKKVLDGYYYTNVTYDKRLEHCPYGSCGVVFYGDSIHLVSYTTRVISIDCDGFLSCTGTYSPTTRKHINAFLKEYAPSISYQIAKKCYTDSIAINIYTGEVINI